MTSSVNTMSKYARVLEEVLILLQETMRYHQTNDKVVGLLKNEIEHLWRYLRIVNMKRAGTDGRVQLAFVGRASTGKSSLINAILGEPLLPQGINPTSSFPLTLDYVEGGDFSCSIEYETKASRDVEVFRSAVDVCDWLTSNAFKAADVECVCIASSRFELLRGTGCTLIDTPGFLTVGPAGKSHTDKLIAYCHSKKPLVLWLASLNTVREEKEFFHEMLRDYFYDLILSKSDTFDGSVTKKTLHKVRENLQLPDYSKMHVVSTRTDSQTTQDSSSATESVLSLREYIRSTFTEESLTRTLVKVISSTLAELTSRVGGLVDKKVWSPFAATRLTVNLGYGGGAPDEPLTEIVQAYLTLIGESND